MVVRTVAELVDTAVGDTLGLLINLPLRRVISGIDLWRFVWFRLSKIFS